jgi:hypothetical protein
MDHDRGKKKARIVLLRSVTRRPSREDVNISVTPRHGKTSGQCGNCRIIAVIDNSAPTMILVDSVRNPINDGINQSEKKHLFPLVD